MRQICLLLTWLGLVLLKAETSIAGITQEQIFAHYKNIQSLDAEILQSKQSPLLLKPLTSHVKLRYKDGLLSWEPEAQAAIQLRFAVNKEPEWVKGPDLPGLNDPIIKKRMLATLEAVRDLLLISPRLSARFDLDLHGDILSLSPKVGVDSGFLQKIELKFAANLTLLSMRLMSIDDDTSLIFERLNLDRGVSAGVKSP
ncbi:MAG: hypothetical protein NTX25_04245 [Proteobacteria bacterium]|nr:hypothetical protein [Pseudomonadota bacterium]